MDKSIEIENKFMIAQGWGWEYRLTVNSPRVPDWSDGSILKLDCGDDCTTK